MNQLKKCKKLLGVHLERVRIERTHRLENSESPSMYRLKRILMMMKWLLELTSKVQVTVSTSNLIGVCSIMIWLFIKILLARPHNNISKTKPSRWGASLENKLIRKRCMFIIRAIRKSKANLITYRDLNLKLHSLIMKSRIYMMICLI